jgi:hypothetical protein
MVVIKYFYVGAMTMEEMVGICTWCEKEIFCRGGFLEGLIFGDQQLLCLQCKDEEQPQNE